MKIVNNIPDEQLSWYLMDNPLPRLIPDKVIFYFWREQKIANKKYLIPNEKNYCAIQQITYDNSIEVSYYLFPPLISLVKSKNENITLLFNREATSYLLIRYITIAPYRITKRTHLRLDLIISGTKKKILRAKFSQKYIPPRYLSSVLYSNLS